MPKPIMRSNPFDTSLYRRTYLTMRYSILAQAILMVVLPASWQFAETTILVPAVLLSVGGIPVMHLLLPQDGWGAFLLLGLLVSLPCWVLAHYVVLLPIHAVWRALYQWMYPV